ncbi:conserved hypothetical protein [Bosea sp. 46]|nr:conserved hypothetical protein [Bosea sp. 21B]CAD5284796.1 conserved hypothetical protein [Bosea sp. 7B]CAD5301649.1 conserved hypothetical protein [Bosea sp. 46]VXB74735.1 conserved hypothetical protein [Bosea sp. 125]
MKRNVSEEQAPRPAARAQTDTARTTDFDTASSTCLRMDSALANDATLRSALKSRLG